MTCRSWRHEALSHMRARHEALSHMNVLLRNRLMELNPKAEHKEQALKVLKVCDQNRSYLTPLIKPLTHKLNH